MRRWTWIVVMALVLAAGAPRAAAQGGQEHGAPEPAGPAPTAGAGAMAHLTVTTDPAPAQARQPVDLVVALHDAASGAPLTDLSVEHARLLHLVVVSEDLATFDHLHPLPVDAGVFRLTHTFPTGGRYRLYVGFTSRALGPPGLYKLWAQFNRDGEAITAPFVVQVAP